KARCRACAASEPERPGKEFMMSDREAAGFSLPRRSPPTRSVDVRPWGQFMQLVANEPCSVKVITVHPGEQLSLQSPRLRREWWTVLEGTMAVEIDGERFLMSRDEQAFIPAGTRHRAAGLDGGCRWLEISFGCFDEDDIERFEDIYGRCVGEPAAANGTRP